MQLTVPHGRDGLPAYPRCDRLRHETLAAPGAQNNIRLATYNFIRVGQNSVFAQRLGRLLAENVFAAGDSDQLADPLDPANLRLIPFLEVDPRPARQPGRRPPDRSNVPLKLPDQALGLGLRADHRAEAQDIGQDAVDRAVIADPALNPRLDQVAGNVSLDVGEADDQIRPQLQNPPDLGTGERRYPRLFLACLRRPYREP